MMTARGACMSRQFTGAGAEHGMKITLKLGLPE
jgi:hypothetical protein